MSPLHVVVAGHGMVGDRFAAEVRRHDPAGRSVRLTILAAEPRPACRAVSGWTSTNASGAAFISSATRRVCAPLW